MLVEVMTVECDLQDMDNVKASGQECVGYSRLQLHHRVGNRVASSSGKACYNTAVEKLLRRWVRCQDIATDAHNGLHPLVVQTYQNA